MQSSPYMNTREKRSKEDFPQFEKPKPVGYFSITGGPQRLLAHNPSQLKYFKPPTSFPIDLNEGIENAIKKPENAYKERLDNLLRYIYDTSQKHLARNVRPNELKSPLLDAEFICWRGLLRLLMCSPFEHKQDWSIQVTRYMGTFYLCQRDTAGDRIKRAQKDEVQKRFCSYGFKFEQICLVESPDAEVDTNIPVDECSEFVCVFKSALCGMQMLYGAEMDGITSAHPVVLDRNTPLHSLKFIEVKTGLAIKSQWQEDNFRRFSSRNWWCQSFLVGIEDIYIGKRTHNGFVQNIEHMPVKMLPKVAKDWSPVVCGQFLVKFLHGLRQLMSNINCPHTTYVFNFNAKNGLITHQVVNGYTGYSFLPAWYIAMVQSKAEISINNESRRMDLKRTLINSTPTYELPDKIFHS